MRNPHIYVSSKRPIAYDTMSLIISGNDVIEIWEESLTSEPHASQQSNTTFCLYIYVQTRSYLVNQMYFFYCTQKTFAGLCGDIIPHLVVTQI